MEFLKQKTLILKQQLAGLKNSLEKSKGMCLFSYARLYPYFQFITRNILNFSNHFNFLYFRFQMMYADSYMTKQEFEQMFDHTLYYEMRQKYDCLKAFPNIYEKVSKAARTGKQSQKEEKD